LLWHSLQIGDSSSQRPFGIDIAPEKDRVSAVRSAHFTGLIRQSVKGWWDDYAPSMGAAVSFYTLFSIAPLLIIVIAVAGLVFGADAARTEIIAQLRGLIGDAGATGVQQLLASATTSASGTAAVIGIFTLVLGATSVFAELQSDLDPIWRVPNSATGNGLWDLLRSRLLTFGLVLAVGFLLLVSLVVSTALSAFGTWWRAFFSGWEALAQILNLLISFGLVTALFAVIYKMLPRARVEWQDVWIGAAVTSVLFSLGKLAIGAYLGTSSVTTGFGQAGSVAVLLIWVYYSAQIFLLGAEFTWVFAQRHGSRASGRHA